MMVQQQPSSELVAANERLLLMRAQYRAERPKSAASLPMTMSWRQEALPITHYTEQLELKSANGNYSPPF